MKTVLVVGGGAGGAAAAHALQGRCDVTVIEAGGAFRPFRWDLRWPERLKRLGLMRSPRLIPALFPEMRVATGTDGTVLLTGRGTGGTTTLATANAVRLDGGLRKLGIDLDAEFDELKGVVPITANHRAVWCEPSRRAFDVCEAMGLGPEPLPKMGHQDRCAGCGHCVLGCPHGVKWDARRLLAKARSRGAKLLEGWSVLRIEARDGAPTGVVATSGVGRRFFPADAVVLAAGGLGTPIILEASQIACQARLFVDPVLCVATRWPGARQDRELSMPFFVRRGPLLLAPYFDRLSYYFDRRWQPAAGDIFSLMVKLGDSGNGGFAAGRVWTNFTPEDRAKLNEGVELCTEIFGRLGVDRRELFLGTLNAGHPGGMLPLTAADAGTLHPRGLPPNVWVADASLFPESPAGPPILTIMALARRVARQVAA